ncbi:MAG: hypothetical protein ACJ786_19455 [Catenulispora sp.]
MGNLDFFLTHDAPAARRYRLDPPRLHAAARRIVPAVGATSETFPRRCAELLGAELDRPCVEFPGGHIGFLLRPRAFAARLRQVLAD